MPEQMSKQPIEVVNITSPALNSRLGRYFIAQTGLLNFGNGYNAWGGIINPFNLGVNLYIDIFTITNFSTQSFLGEIWLNADAPIIAADSSTFRYALLNQISLCVLRSSKVSICGGIQPITMTVKVCNTGNQQNLLSCNPFII